MSYLHDCASDLFISSVIVSTSDMQLTHQRPHSSEWPDPVWPVVSSAAGEKERPGRVQPGLASQKERSQKFNSQLCYSIHSFCPSRCILILPVNKQHHKLTVLNCWYDRATGNRRRATLCTVHLQQFWQQRHFNLFMYNNNNNAANIKCRPSSDMTILFSKQT